jgi:ATP-dependent helicase/DNAse subunit B
MERLMEKAMKGFSPSSLNTYIRCSLQFYFQEILGLSEADSVEENIEAKTMGTVIHQVFQKVYEPYAGKYVDPIELSAKLDLTEKYLRDAFSEHYKDGDLDYGKNHLVYKVSLFLVNEFIRQEAEYLVSKDNPASSLKILSLERQFENELTIEIAGKAVQVRYKGKTDRIDQLDDIIRVIDYKTGVVQASELQVKTWDKLIQDPKKGKAFQLLLYGWLLYRNAGNHGLKMQTGNISLRKISEGFIRVKLPGDEEINDESMAVFEELLKSLTGNILDPELPFFQTDDPAICVYCPFKAVCTR